MTRTLIEVPLDRVLDHPLNSHVVTVRDREKLANNIRRSKRYPPLVVRELTEDSEHYPGEPGHYQILDGHQRRLIFEDLVGEGFTQFESVLCDDWTPITDEEALIALATLNSWGASAPRRRAELLHQISRFTALQDAAQILPENQRQITDAMKLLKQPLSDIKRVLDEVHKPDTVSMTFVVAHDKSGLAKFTAAAQIFALYYGARLRDIHVEEGGDQGRIAVLRFDIQNAAKDIVLAALKKAGAELPPGTRNRRGQSLEAMATEYLATRLTDETGVPLQDMEQTLAVEVEADEVKPARKKKKRARPKAEAIAPP